jgi:plasmid replication initiation protein
MEASKVNGFHHDGHPSTSQGRLRYPKETIAGKSPRDREVRFQVYDFRLKVKAVWFSICNIQSEF